MVNSDSTSAAAQSQNMLRSQFYDSIGMDRRQMRLDILNCIPGPLEHVLEIGTGKGFLTDAFASLAPQVTTVDISTNDRSVAESLLAQHGLQDRVTFVQADASSLPFSDNSFDAVVCSYTFHHVAAPLQVVDEMLRVAMHYVVIAEFNAKGFEAVRKAHSEDAGKHDYNNHNFSLVADYVSRKSLTAKTIRDTWQDILFVQK
jgi:ubiquinone/menaquinone biosynthesis C-methylase UbiE